MNNAAPDRVYEFHCASESETDRFARALAQFLPAGVAVGLLGTLGAGKTHLVRGLVGAMGGNAADVVSPTFVLCQHYVCGERMVHHLDAYRIRDDDEFLELGVDELFDSQAITLVEWAGRVQACLPQRQITIEIEVVSERSRRIRMWAACPKLAPCLAEIALAYGES